MPPLPLPHGSQEAHLVHGPDMPLPHTHSDQGGAEGQGGLEVAPAKARGWHQAERGGCREEYSISWDNLAVLGDAPEAYR